MKQNIQRRFLAVVGMLAMLLGLLPGAAYAEPLPAQIIVSVMGTTPTIVQMAVNDGAGGQTDPHVSGDWVSYTDNSVYGIRFQNLDLGFASDRPIPHADGVYDSLSDLGADSSGYNVVFMRADVYGYQGVYMAHIDPFGNPNPIVEVSPDSNVMLGRIAVDGDTIAYEDHRYSGLWDSPSEISVSSTLDPNSPAYRLTNDALDDQFPAVSPDGNAVVWRKCSSSTTCDVWRAERVNGAWGAPEQLTGAEGNETFPHTNGPVTVYASTAGGDNDIRWSVKGASGAYVESVLALPGTQRNPNISGNLIVFESNITPGSQFDIYLYDLATNRLYQLTNTTISESLTDISTGPGGLVRVAWAQPKQVYPFDMDVYALSFLIDTAAPFITPTIQGTLGQNGWYTSDVSLTWSVTDNESPVDSTSGCEDVNITRDQAATDYTCLADSDGGANSATVSIQRDAAKPVTTVTGVAEGANYELGSVSQAGCSSTDALSGVATEATVVLTGGDAQGVGSITATCSGALDRAGNAADPAAVHFTVSNPASETYDFTGFLQPVDNPGQGPSYVFNSVKAGAAVPVKFSLNGDQGLDIFAAGSPTSRPASCTSAGLTDPIEETVAAGSSSLSYDEASDTYTYVWKTNKLWVGTCRALNLTLSDGTQHLAYFRFK